jgi:hypothetical protein
VPRQHWPRFGRGQTPSPAPAEQAATRP